MNENSEQCKYLLPCGRCELTKEMCGKYSNDSPADILSAILNSTTADFLGVNDTPNDTETKIK